jgi:hypothetical protein
MERWESFYVIVGSSAAALIGIQFVVITIVGGLKSITTAESINAFATPTIVHLAFALVVSAHMSAPWTSPFPISAGIAALGLGGLVYLVIVLRRARHQTAYQPVWEDWIWHVLLPAASYTALVAGAVLLHAAPPAALFTIAGSALALLLIAIHNAWDAVVHVILMSAKEDK